MFMLIRHLDHINDDRSVRTLIQGAISHVKKTIKKRGQTDIELKTLWLSNTLRLLHCLKQYSGETQFQVSLKSFILINVEFENNTEVNFSLNSFSGPIHPTAKWSLSSKFWSFCLQTSFVRHSRLDLSRNHQSDGGGDPTHPCYCSSGAWGYQQLNQWQTKTWTQSKNWQQWQQPWCSRYSFCWKIRSKD